jgi:effector-binding domain-containing protein
MPMSYTVQIETIAPAFAAVGRVTCPAAELSKHVPALCGTAWNFIKARKIATDGHMIAIYRNADLAALQIEAGARVLAPFPDTPEIACVQIPSGPAAATTHIGPYHQLKQAHDAIVAWCKANHRQRSGITWELYDHPTLDPATTRTFVYHQLA